MHPPFPSVSACGKVILLGEHAVVYGYKALCSSISQGVTIFLIPGQGRILFPLFGKKTKEARLLLEQKIPSASPPFSLPSFEPSFPSTLVFPSVLTSVSDPNSFPDSSVKDSLVQYPENHPFQAAYQAVLFTLCQSFSLSSEPFLWDFYVTFQVPVGAGLGSSAAFSVALVKALSLGLSLPFSNDQIFSLAQVAEQVFHGQSSGLDATLATFGGMGIFQKGFSFQHEKLPSFSLCIGYTGQPKDTKSRVMHIARLMQNAPEKTKNHLQTIGELAQQGVSVLKQGDLVSFGKLMNQNQAELNQLEASTPQIEQMCTLALQAGAYGAKLTGGGGGGCVIALASEESPIQTAWQQAGYSSFFVTLGG